MSVNALVEQLKKSGQDFEFYPTTQEMITAICEYHSETFRKRFDSFTNFGDVLDIGCGTCNFKKYVDNFNSKFMAKESRTEKTYYKDGAVLIGNYYVMEKSRILLERLPVEAICIGTDFIQNTLIDKEVHTIFCNPPYSEYENWTCRILLESDCKNIYLIIPQRWKDNENIQNALKKLGQNFRRFNGESCCKVVGSFDFLDAERAARAKVDILHIDKTQESKEAGFSRFFDEVFKMKNSEEKSNEFDWTIENKKFEKLKTELTTGKNKVEILCDGYNHARQELFEHFKVITALEPDILESIGIKKENVKEALKLKFKGLKALYWRAAFDCIDAITKRLTSKSRDSLIDKFKVLKKVDFTAENVYSMVVWAINNSNDYTKQQIINLFDAMSQPENVKNYKSNQKVFERNEWGYCNTKHDHYTLDYRIICSKSMLPGNEQYFSNGRVCDIKVSDICTVIENLGFSVGEKQFPKIFGQLGTVYDKDGEILFSCRFYQNGNVHIKFNKEVIKALNVVVSREKGWIHNASDIKKEFNSDMAQGAEKYFVVNPFVAIETGSRLMLN